MDRKRSVTTLFFALLLWFAALMMLVSVASAAITLPVRKAPTSFADLVDKVKHSVVNISTTQIIKESPLQPFLGPNNPFGDNFFKFFFGNIPPQEFKTHALGSGFVISKDGYILTNNHVVANATQIMIKLDTGTEYQAKLIGTDPKTDLALLKVKPDKNFPAPVKLGDSDAVRVGDWVMAVGNPFGLGQTVTVGIISAKGRIIGAGPYDDFLQTDAAINPGNSGGPLFDMKGRVVGINTAIISRAQNIGFAIPINMAKALLPQLKSGKIVRGWLGVTVQNLTQALAKSFGLKITKGALVSDIIKDSPAQRAGLKRGDVIIEFNGKRVNSAHDLSRMVAQTTPGTNVTIGIIREGKQIEIQVKIGKKGEQTISAVVPASSRWGLTVQNISPELVKQYGLEKKEPGVLITYVRPNSPASNAGLQPGDIVKEIGRRKITDVRDYEKAIREAHSELLLLVKRRGSTFYVVLSQKP